MQVKRKGVVRPRTFAGLTLLRETYAVNIINHNKHVCFQNDALPSRI